MPTWSMPARDEEFSKKTRSPGWASASDATARPAVACCDDVRGRLTPRSAYTCCTRPEQSNPVLASVPPQVYGTPRYLCAACTTAEPLPLTAVPAPVALLVPVSPAAAAALAHWALEDGTAVREKRAWISPIRLCTALSPSTSSPPLRPAVVCRADR